MKVRAGPKFRKCRRSVTLRTGLGRLLLSMVLLLALLLSGTVPQGMMRVAGADADGVRLVLCTPDGLRDAWMAPDGTIVDSDPLPAETHETSDCLAVSVALGTGQPLWPTALKHTEFSAFILGLGPSWIGSQSTLAPAQPCAPPFYS